VRGRHPVDEESAMPDVIWKSLEWCGVERLQLEVEGAGVTAKGQLVGDPDGVPVGALYEIQCDAAWNVVRVAVQVLGRSRLDLTRAPDGTWGANGHPLPSLDGCVDVDLSLTPFTNTLPIRRLSLAPGQAADLKVAYVKLPGLQVAPAHQRYICQRRDERGALYRYESGSFRADVTVDEDGLVTTYEGLWVAVPPRSSR
jgi:uncharacterized protein